MIDIIVVDRGEFLEKTLFSILMQTIIDQVHVIVVRSNYDTFFSSFRKRMSLQEVYVSSCESIGEKRRIGLSEASHDYVLFMDGGDTFYDVFSLANMYYSMDGNDAIIGGVFNDSKPYLNIYLVGNLYRKSYLIKHHIFFCQSDGEENGFQHLFIMSGGTYQYCNDYVYYRNRQISWDDCSLDILKDVFSSIEIASKRHYAKEKIAFVLYDVLLLFSYLYHDGVLNLSDQNLENLISSLKTYYDSYQKYVNRDMKIFLSEVQGTICEVDDVYVKEFLES